MYAINELTRRKTSLWNLTKGIVHKDDNYIEFGYFRPTPEMIKTFYQGVKYYDIRNIEMEEVFSLIEGRILKFEKRDPDIKQHKNVYGNGYFPYAINREYEAEKHIDLFENDASLNLTEDTMYSYSSELNHSFGIEFETAAGYVSEKKCFELGLIPLRDGSISGIEYSTIPMVGNSGLCLLKRQLEELKKSTYTNKECSVHMHLGGYPVTPKSIFILHTLWYYVQDYVLHYVPAYSYRTDAFKRNGKNYCGIVNHFKTFKDMYQFYTGQKYMGDLYQPHPADIEKRAKWNIKTRYFNCNFINMLCYNSAKTVEFRFLTPTYSFDKLSTFLLIFNGILRYGEKLYKQLSKCTDEEIIRTIKNLDDNNDLNIKSIMQEVYSEDTYNMILNNLEKLEWLKETQNNVGDNCGSRLDIENRYFPDGKQES